MAEHKLVHHKFFHGGPVALVGLRVLVFVSDHVGVDEGFFPVIEGIIIGKIHADDLGKRLLDGILHGLNVILVTPGDPKILLHAPLIPDKTLSVFSPAFEQKADDRAKKALGGIFRINFFQRVHKARMVLPVTAGQLHDLHDQLRIQKIFLHHKA